MLGNRKAEKDQTKAATTKNTSTKVIFRCQHCQNFPSFALLFPRQPCRQPPSCSSTTISWVYSCRNAGWRRRRHRFRQTRSTQPATKKNDRSDEKQQLHVPCIGSFGQITIRLLDRHSGTHGNGCECKKRDPQCEPRRPSGREGLSSFSINVHSWMFLVWLVAACVDRRVWAAVVGLLFPFLALG